MPKAKPFTWEGITYESMTDAANALKVSVHTIWHRAGRHNKVAIKWNNVEYKSLADAAKEMGITGEAMRQRLQKGYTCDDDMYRRRLPTCGMCGENSIHDDYHLCKECRWE